MKQSAAENDLQKYVLFKQKNERLQKTIKDIGAHNVTVKTASAEIDQKIEVLEP